MELERTADCGPFVPRFFFLASQHVPQRPRACVGDLPQRRLLSVITRAGTQICCGGGVGMRIGAAGVRACFRPPQSLTLPSVPVGSILFLRVCSTPGIIKVRKHNGVISRLWEELCFACVGEWFADPDVVGITLSTRAKDDNIAVWNSGINGTGMNASIGEVRNRGNMDSGCALTSQCGWWMIGLRDPDRSPALTLLASCSFLLLFR